MPSSKTPSPSTRAVQPSPVPALEGSGPVVLALLQVHDPHDWTGLESALIRLEAILARQQGRLNRQQVTLTLYVPVGGPNPASARQLDVTRLQAALECVEQLAEALEQHGGRSAVITLGQGPLDPSAGSPPWLEAAKEQLTRAPDPSLRISDELLEQLPANIRRYYHLSLSSLPGFRQRRPPREAPSQRYRRLQIQARESLAALRRALHSAMHWRPLRLAVPGITMFFLAPYFLELPNLQTARRPTSPTDSALILEEAGVLELESPGERVGRDQVSAKCDPDQGDTADFDLRLQDLPASCAPRRAGDFGCDEISSGTSPTCGPGPVRPPAFSAAPALQPLPVSGQPLQTASDLRDR